MDKDIDKCETQPGPRYDPHLRLGVLREVLAHIRFYSDDRPNTMDETLTALDAYWKWVSAE